MHTYILRRRGPWAGHVINMLVVVAISAPHARVAAYGRTEDLTWTSNTQSSCEEIALDKERVYA